MSKKNKKSVGQGQSQRYPVEAPYVVDMEVLAYSSDDELRERNNYLNSTKEQVVRAGLDPYLWEVELAYVHREMGIRDTRHAAHERYLRSNPDNVQFESYDNDSYVDNNSLPN